MNIGTKTALKMLMILTPGVNFTNVLRAAFTYVSCAHSFFCIHFRFVLYWRKPTGTKAARRTLVNLTPGGARPKRKKFLFFVRRKKGEKEKLIIAADSTLDFIRSDKRIV